MASTKSQPAAAHLCVLVHGLWGSPDHLWYLVQELRKEHPDLHVLVPKRNVGNFTYDGIEVGGERVTQEIEDELLQLKEKGTEIKKISVIGYSLGGLVARYAVGLLYHKGWFEKLEPVNFTTFATPHLGVRTPLVGFHNTLWNVIGARTLSISGRQLFTVDKFRDTGRPLLAVLADPESIFIRALSQFKTRSLYSNVVNDRSAVFYTTCISKVDPFVKMSALNINYLSGYAPVILDTNNPVTPKSTPDRPVSNSIWPEPKTILSRLRMGIFVSIFLPIGATLFLSNAAVQSIMSGRRIKQHIEGKAGVAAKDYQIPLFGNVQRTAESMYENMGGGQSQEYLPEDSTDAAPSSPLLTSKQFDWGKFGGNGDADHDGSIKEPSSQEFPTLALTADQFAMVDALDNLGWKKHMVYIHNVNHSHAAIIVRMKRASFDEGKVVVKHWLSEFKL